MICLRKHRDISVLLPWLTHRPCPQGSTKMTSGFVHPQSMRSYKDAFVHVHKATLLDSTIPLQCNHTKASSLTGMTSLLSDEVSSIFSGITLSVFQRENKNSLQSLHYNNHKFPWNSRHLAQNLRHITYGAYGASDHIASHCTEEAKTPDRHIVEFES